MVVDIYIVAGLSVAIFLALCVAVMYSMRDSRSAPSRVVSRSVWCAPHRECAAVDFVERVETGLTIRSVERCSLRGEHEHCAEDCVLLLAETPGTQLPLG